MMNALGLDVATVGNHEFDAGIDELKRLVRGGCRSDTPDSPATSCAAGRYAGAKFAVLAANVLEVGGRPVFAPYVIKRYGGIPVGVIGAVTRSTPGIVVASGVAGLRFTDEAAAVNRAARELRALGVEAIVAVFHEGGEIGTPGHRGDWNDESCPGARGPIFGIAKRLSRDIDVIFSAHSHQGYRCVVDGRVIIQGTSNGRGVSVVDVVLDAQTRDIDPARTRSINLPVVGERADAALRERLAAALPAPYATVLRSARPDAAIARRVEEYAAIVAPRAQRPIGRIVDRFARGPGSTDSAAGRLIADAQLAATRAADRGGAEIALMNPGGIRSNLECAGRPPCNVSYGQLFTMQPFGNNLVVMSLSGAQIKALLESQQKPSASAPTLLQPSEGFTYLWRGGAPRGERVRDIRLNGVAIEPERRYRVTVNSFLAEGGDGFTMLREGTERQGGAQDLDALIAYVAAAPPKSPVRKPRIQWLP